MHWTGVMTGFHEGAIYKVCVRQRETKGTAAVWGKSGKPCQSEEARGRAGPVLPEMKGRGKLATAAVVQVENTAPAKQRWDRERARALNTSTLPPSYLHLRGLSPNRSQQLGKPN